MPLVFAGITPHPPLLIPAIGKDQIKKIEKTKSAMDKLEKELYVTKPQMIFIISPHSGLFEDSFSINAHTHFISDFDKFGDLSTKLEWNGTPDMSAKISNICKDNNMPLQLVSKEKLDHGASVPLFYLTRHLKNTKVMPIGYSHLSAIEHIRFGELLKEIIMNDERRIAVIASGDLSHNLDKLEEGSENFDEKLKHFIENKVFGSMLELDKSTLLKESNECGYRSILILIGILKEANYSFADYTYEHPFGVGYLTGSFDF